MSESVSENSQKNGVPAGAENSEIAPEAASNLVPAENSKSWLSGFFQLNFIEMMERLAYNSVRVVAPIYIMQADNAGGLRLTAADKGTLYAWWAIVQCFLPILTGGLADRYGYKKMMTISVAAMSVGYLLMAFLRDLPALDAAAGTLGVSGNYL